MVRWLVAVAMLAGLLAAGQACTLFDDDPPDDSCSSDNDCFRAQGERCIDKHCKLVNNGADAGVDSP
jgi:hypothetical protein